MAVAGSSRFSSVARRAASLPLNVFAMNVFAMNLPTGRIDDRYLQVLIVAQAVVAKVLCKLFAMIDRVGVGIEIDSDPVSERDAIFHIEKEFLHFPRLELLQWKSSTRLRVLGC
jgi:hypothetical protein